MCSKTTPKIDFFTAFEKHIKGQPVKEYVSYPVYGDYNLPMEERHYGDGIKCKNGYQMISHGGGCSGEDCNTTFILSPRNKIISVRNW